MFDDQVQQGSQQEPQDIFSETSPATTPSQNISNTSASPAQPTMPPPYTQEHHGGFNPKIIVIVVVILAILVIAAFGIQFALRGREQAVTAPTPTPTAPTPPQQQPQPVPSEQPVSQEAPSQALPEPVQPPAETPTAVTPPLDEDGDGLTNDEELNLGTKQNSADTDADDLQDGAEVKTYRTNPLVADSDTDGLTDGNEVAMYKSDPLNPDTDGDGYLDGAEVSNGYSPLGAGKLNAPAQ